MFVQQLCKNDDMAASDTPSECVFIRCRFLEVGHTLNSCLFPFVVVVIVVVVVVVVVVVKCACVQCVRNV